jgi:hypothetical protein
MQPDSVSVGRDFLASLVDWATVMVGVATVVTLAITLWAQRSQRIQHEAALRTERENHEAVLAAERERHETVLRIERERHEEAWRRQIAIDHHARIYEAAAELITAITAFTRRAEARVQARGSAHIDHGFSADADETTDFEYAAFLDSRGASVADIVACLDSASSARHRLYFLIPGGDGGQTLLTDLIVIEQVLATVRPERGYDSGRGDPGSVLDSHGVREAVENLVSTERLGPDKPTARLRFVRELGERYFLGRIGRFVPPPPLAPSS